MDIWALFGLQNYTNRLVFICISILAITAGSMGNFVYVKRKSLIGDAIAHALLPGIAIAFLIAKEKNYFMLTLGATVAGLLAIYFAQYLIHATKIKSDTAIAITLSLFFGMGIVLMTYIQQSGLATQSGLDHYIFGSAASILKSDLYFILTLAVIVMLLLIIWYRGFFVHSFDPVFSQTIGFPSKLLNFLMNLTLVGVILIGLQTVGILLIVALLISPSSIASNFTPSFKKRIVIAIIAAFIATYIGVQLSFGFPKMPTGPWIVVSLSTMTFLALLFAPQNGIFARYLKKRRQRFKILHENILKTMYQINESSPENKALSLAMIQTRRHIPTAQLRKGLQQLNKNKLVTSTDNIEWKLTKLGASKGRRITRLHRLWELYLSEYMDIASDHVHDNAESIEHIITPEIEQKLQHKLKFPKEDPHQTTIPYDQ